jgi:hypothetical protein
MLRPGNASAGRLIRARPVAGRILAMRGCCILKDVGTAQVFRALTGAYTAAGSAPSPATGGTAEPALAAK